MSLRIFHIVFVVVSIGLSLFVTAWGIRQWVDEKSLSALVVGLLFLLSGIVLTIYGARVFRKLKALE